MLKRIIPALLAAVLLCGCSSNGTNPPPEPDQARHCAALAEFWGDTSDISDTPAEQFAFRYSDTLDGIVITNYKGAEDEVRVPAEIDGQPVIKVDLRACYRNIQSLVIPDSVRDVRLASYEDMVSHYKDQNFAKDSHLSYYYVSELGGCVVNDYYGAKSILRIPDMLENPENHTEKWTVKRVRLDNCKKDLSLLIIPDSVELVEAKQYEEITITASELKSQIEENLPDITQRRGVYSGMGVEKMNIPASLYQDRRITFANTTLTEVFIPETISALAEGLFMNSPLLERAVIGSQHATVGKHAFFGCKSLAEVNLSDAVRIEDWAFSHCDTLSEITLGEKLTYIGSGAFQHCSSLGAVHIPPSVEYIGAEAFSECKNLQSITISPENCYYSCTNGIIEEK